MGAPPRLERHGGEENQLPSDGVRLTFASPELLYAYILSPKRPTDTTLAERISGIRETPLGEFSLDGSLFTSVKFTLVVEPDKDPRGQRPTAIIRADLQLGEQDSALLRMQTATPNRTVHKVTSEEQDNTDYDYIPGSSDYFYALAHDFVDNPSKQQELYFVGYGKTVARIYGELPDSGLQKVPLALLQIRDPEIDTGSISISLFSYGRYAMDFRTRDNQTARAISDGLQVDPADGETWHFTGPVGVDVSDEKEFNKSLAFFEKAFSTTVSAIYRHEGMPIPSVRLEVEPPLVFEQEEKTFADVGGQHDAVTRLKGIGASEKNGIVILTQGRCVLLEGPYGYGKSSMVEALSHELGIPLIVKTSLDIPRKGEIDIISLFQSWFLDAKAAAKRSGGKAILSPERLEVFLNNPITQDIFLNLLEEWQEDPEVLVVATSNEPFMLDEGMRNRFTEIPVPRPHKAGLREILEISVAKIAKVIGRNIFSDVDLDEIAERWDTNRSINVRKIEQILGAVSSLSRLRGLPITTDFLLGLIPSQRLGFNPPSR